MNTDDIIQEILTAKFVDESITAITWKIVGIAEVLAVMFFLINMGWNYVTTTLKQGQSGKFFDFSKLVGAVVIMAFIGLYVPAMKGILGLADSINSVTAWNMQDRFKYLSDVNQKLIADESVWYYEKHYRDQESNLIKAEEGGGEKMSQDEIEAQKEEVYIHPNDREFSMWDMFNHVGSPSGLMSMFLTGLTFVIKTIVKFLIYIFTLGLIKVLFIIGPLAFAFSLLPMFRDKLNVWFGTLMNACFVFTTMNILDAIVDNLFWETMLTTGHVATSNMYADLAINLAIIVLYCLTYWLTGKFVGSDSAGKVLSTAISGATMVAGVMAARALGSAASTASNSSTAANVANTGKDSIKGN